MFILIVLGCSTNSKGQLQDTLIYKGQLSAWANYNLTHKQEIWGARYIPELNYQNDFSDNQSLNINLAANIFVTGTSINNMDGDIKPYRAWARYASQQLEIRVGLQKINFGSATMLRPLMWFDQMDPRDPLQLTDGVWGFLGRYYFLNNAIIWLWGLYGNEGPKGWEVFKTEKGKPEFGGRVQLPINIGEVALTYHHRIVHNDIPITLPNVIAIRDIPENRFGVDAKIDWILGFWVEGAWSNFGKNIGLLTNQAILNIGADYTFGVGNGILAVYEHLLASSDASPFEFKNKMQFSLLSLSYPVGLFDNLGSMFYYSWDNNQVYSFLTWQRTYNRISLHLMAYWNPETFDLPQQNIQSNLFGGKGVQFMFVFNH